MTLGSIFLSQVINDIPARFLSSTFLAVPYSPPRRRFDLDVAKEMTEKVTGFERFGYMRSFCEEDAWKGMNYHMRILPS